MRLEVDDESRSVVTVLPFEGVHKVVKVDHGVEAKSLELIRHLNGQTAHEIGHPRFGRKLVLLLGNFEYFVDGL